jgi:hypothetical protein
MEPDPSDDEVLRAKYLDWCSAKVADRFLRLTPEEIYELAQRASSEGGVKPSRAANGSALPPADESEGASFREIVEQVTAVLTAELDLPGFETWARAYTRDPAQYDEELLGLWRERLKK